MSIEEYRNFKYLVDAYLELRDKNLLKEIRQKINTKKRLRRELIKELDDNVRYIEVFSKEYQIKIGMNILNREKNRKYSAYKSVWILFYMSKQAVNEIFKNVDQRTLNDIQYEIKNIIRENSKIKHYKQGKNKLFSRIGEKIAWKRFSIICNKYIK